ncbi:hypothetical protein BG015_010802 [Linnemannia schmuckeri]|uniref:Uncharacterized protein n=1 Tax=Linnemannia schmuckeri TaxID=64567 RepID=A0A9P5RTI1_9FUNG|nr:hypothetical protein BG015_010802 [Linnemannia schmuckeri]
MIRTQLTAENFLNGLYPLNTRNKNDVITLNTYPSQVETLALNTVMCSKLTALYSIFKATTYTHKIKASYVLVNKVNTMMGWNKVPTYNQTSATIAQDPTQCLTVDEVLKMSTLSSFIYTSFFREFPQAELAKRLAVGPFLKTIAASIRATVAAADVAKAKPSHGHSHSSKKRRVRPFELCPAHDQSLDQVLSVIAVPSTVWPVYAGSLIFETYKTVDKRDVIRMLYEAKVVSATSKLNCTLDACPLETFLDFIKSYVPADIKAECGL